MTEDTQQEQVQQQFNPEDIFAYGMQTYLPSFKVLLHGMGAKAKVRVILALMEYPLNAKKLNLLTKAEQDAVSIGSQLLEAKYALILHLLNQKMSQEGENNEQSTETKEN